MKTNKQLLLSIVSRNEKFMNILILFHPLPPGPLVTSAFFISIFFVIISFNVFSFRGYKPTGLGNSVKKENI